ncbi:MFS transporter [Streptomyces sp. MN03-5084-2B]|nr:MFS transporter [Streptomyces sp. MN03-5084-2B]
MTTTSAPMSPVLTAARRWAILVICASSLFLVGLDTTIVNVALPRIGHGLAAGTRALEWVVDAYTIVFASLLITSGALADRFGRRRIFQLGLVGFGLASVACAAAPSVGALIAARAVQGVAASMLSPVALAIVVNATPDPRERARAIGVWASVFGLSMAAGPVAGGALLAGFGWRSVFWINVPLVAAAVVLVAKVVPESRGGHARRLDPVGQVLLAGLLALVVGLLIEAPALGWTSPIILGGYAGVAAMSLAFAWVELRRPAPLIDPRLFRRPPFAAAVLGAVAVFVALSVTVLFTTFYLQEGRGWTPLAAGTAVLPLAVGATVCAPLSGILTGRLGPRVPLVLAGVFIAAGGGVLWAALTLSTITAVLLAAYLLLGIGVGFANAPITNTAVSGLPPERAGVAGGITSTARQVGSAVGIAIAGGLVAGARSEAFTRAIYPGWLVAACGLSLLVVAAASHPRDASPSS